MTTAHPRIEPNLIPELFLRNSTHFSPDASSYVFQLEWLDGSNDPWDTNPSLTSPQTLAASASDHLIKIYNVESLGLIQALKFHTKTIQHIQAVPGQPQALISASDDGRVALWDLRLATETHGPVQVFTAPPPAYAQSKPSQAPAMLAADISRSGHLLVAGTEYSESTLEAAVSFYDLRQAADRSVVQVYRESHGDDVTQVKFHPLHHHILLTGSEDGLLCLFDTQQADEEDAITAVGNTSSTVNRAGWFGPSAEFIYSLSPLENFSLWSVQSDGLDPVHQWSDIRRFGGPSWTPDYAIDCHYNPRTQRLFLLTGSHEGQVQSFHVGADDVQLCQVLNHGHAELVRAAIYSPDQAALISGGEDSRLTTWSNIPPPPVESEPSEMMETGP
ncbi:hypothetical protein H4R33_004771 [Dimargaris cristalligena]|uniref:WD40-repeat-containing domain protein n=1 Tax=Dimargaris cristalligena TaxID=215637 RepID=A0A4P9ZUV0_9FUNG|nr:hypothetical protein H4R33_004771 [Dimargaris cristalligena]RKP37337.1 WD40-repeat-containing domain protein [Dimargaris cristalligena]|eukprot:RKP37337.1 WD40-repeat-containing domain protein [Dimargaris cristalligena]